ncbi:MAG: GGDEF domain-containing protein [Clostridia bacterium]|nr:GGDEF domain-containing protein [Clostridia bacterium]
MIKKIVLSILLIVFICSNPTPVSATINIDKDTVNTLIDDKNFEDAYRILIDSLNESDSDQKLKTLRMILEVDNLLGDTDQLLLHGLELVDSSIQKNSSYDEMIGYYYLGNVYYKLYEDTKALEYFEKMLDVANRYNYELGKGFYHTFSGLISYSYEEYDIALDSFVIAQSHLEKAPLDEDWIFGDFLEDNDIMLSITKSLVNDPSEIQIETIDAIGSSYMDANWNLKLNALWESSFVLNKLGAYEKSVALLEEAYEHLQSTNFGDLYTNLQDYLKYDLAYAYYNTGEYQKSSELVLEDAYDYDIKEEVNRSELINDKLRTLENRSLEAESQRQMRIIGIISAFSLLLILLILIIIKEYFKVKSLTKEVYEKSIKDGLTGLYNRMALVDRYEKEISSKTALAIVDIDDFKDINDSYGHLIGDEVIRKIAEVIEHTMIGIGYAGRYGGEEFLIVIQNTEKTNPWDIAEALRLNVEAIRWSFKSEPITVSIGLLCHSKSNFDEGFKTVDDLLYAAKESGKNMTLSTDYNL